MLDSRRSGPRVARSIDRGAAASVQSTPEPSIPNVGVPSHGAALLATALVLGLCVPGIGQELVVNQPYTIRRRPAPTATAREVALPTQGRG